MASSLPGPFARQGSSQTGLFARESYDIQIEEGDVYVQMTLTAPGCGMGPMIAQQAEWAISEVEGVEDVQVEMTFEPPWSPDLISEDGKKLLGID